MKTKRTSPRVARAPGRTRLALSVSQSRQITKLADMMEIKPSVFLRWIVGDEIQSLRDPELGLLSDWTQQVLIYDTPEEEARVKRRVSKWIAQQRAIKARRGRKEEAAS